MRFLMDTSSASLPQTAHAALSWGKVLPPSHSLRAHCLAGLLTVLSDVLALMMAAILVQGGYAAFSAQQSGTIAWSYPVYLPVAVAFFVMARLICGDYKLTLPYAFSSLLYRIGLTLSLSCALSILLLVALMPLPVQQSLEPLVFTILGSLAVVLGRMVLQLFLRQRTDLLDCAARRVFLVGFQEDIAGFERREKTVNPQTRIIGSTVLRTSASVPLQQEDLSLAVSIIRFLKPDDVVILLPWTHARRLEECIQALRSVPARLYLWPAAVLGRMEEANVALLGKLPALALDMPQPFFTRIVLKRLLDVVLSLVALVVLAPLFMLIALAIMLDSAGPVFYTQRRYGFNQEAFPMLKFRSMHPAASSAFRQAVRNDPRITRVGRFLRRWNLDELPQLVNVLRGEMSLVGPRPHAVAHDQQFMMRIASYACRHNVRPGITGWAQVNGYRGETATDTAMIRRVEHDIHYITHWSLWLDMKILFLTVASRKAFLNAR